MKRLISHIYVLFVLKFWEIKTDHIIGFFDAYFLEISRIVSFVNVDYLCDWLWC